MNGLSEIEVPWLLPALFWMTGVAIGYAIHVFASRRLQLSAERQAEETLRKAAHEAGVIVREANVKAEAELLRAREDADKEHWQNRKDLQIAEERIVQREAQLDRRSSALDEKERIVEERRAQIDRDQAAIQQEQKRLESLGREQDRQLQTVAALSPDEARRMLFARLEEELKAETSSLIRRRHDEAIARARDEARMVLVSAMERSAVDFTGDATTTTVVLPSDEMKGRLIGREGRNFRALESALCVNIVIDDTPGVVVVSSFDPVRREIARRTIEQLVIDGRIQPARIEEIAAKVQSELEADTLKAGEEAAAKLGLQGLDPEVIRQTGRLRFRHSYGQNVLQHSLEMGRIMGLMAAEMGLDPLVARRCGLLHDIGKVLAQDSGNSHALAGADFLRKHGESAVVCNAVGAHHSEVEAESIYAVLTRIADTVTASRPGARAESTDIYLKRLEKLEELARSFPGVAKCYAMEAGREIRVLVEPGKIDDVAALLLARDLTRLIEQHLEYPGQIKVTVIRETRFTEYAR